MGLNDTTSSERLRISFFGVRNAGKSSLVNAVTNQDLSIVSDIKGTTTDPVKKSMELLPLGPVVIIDTPGIDDEGEIGEKRIKKTRSILQSTDIAVLVTEAVRGLTDADKEMIGIFNDMNLPYIIAYNKSDLTDKKENIGENGIYVSALTGYNIEELKNKLGSFAKKTANNRRIVSDIINQGDTVVLVIPIDKSAPKGRLILPQQQTIRDILDAHSSAVCCQTEELKDVLNAVKPALVITDSQAFAKVMSIVPQSIPLTSFSILFAHYKGNLDELINGADALNSLIDGDRVLISEGCTHHRQCGDIGTVKLPKWIEKYTGKKLVFSFTSGGDFPDDLSGYSVIVHCGGCMLNEKEMAYRQKCAKQAGVPMVNYGMAIAHINGILERSLEVFKNRDAKL